jgi:hypothetical protein
MTQEDQRERFPTIPQYKVSDNTFESNLQRIHNIIARHINTVIREINCGNMTERANMYVGTDQHASEELLFLGVINQIKLMINEGTRLEQSNLDFLAVLIKIVSELTGINPELISDCTALSDKAQKNLDSRRNPSFTIKRLRTKITK